MAQQEQATIKFRCKTVTRLLKIAKDSKYEDVCELVKRSFGVTQFKLQYKDEEGDLVQLGSQVELQEALRVAGKIRPLIFTVLTDENPSMNPVEEIEPFNSNTTGGGSQLAQSSVTAYTSNSQSALTDPMANLQINERPKEKVRVRGGTRPGRKRMGFYASLCNDVANVDLGSSSSSSSSINECSQPHGKSKKKSKHPKGSKYYSALAEDVAAMKLGVCQTSEDAKQQKHIAKSKDDVSHKGTVGMALQEGHTEDCDTNVLEKQTQSPLGGSEPPTWFNKAFEKMSDTVSTKVLGALNGAVIASIPTTNGQLGQPVKRDYTATYLHDGITCDGCHQAIVGSRYKCGNCPDFDLCEQCDAIEGIHNSSHVFLKLRFPGIGIGRKHGVMIPLLKDIIYKNKNVELAEEQDRKMKDVRKKLKQLAKKKREEQTRLKKGERKVKKFKGSNSPEVSTCELELIFVGDGSYPDGTAVAPEAEFTKCWKIRNAGNVAWNDETKLTYLYGAVKSILHEVELPHLQPGEEGTVSANFIAPAEDGQYFSVWRAAHDGRGFGSKMWCKIKVVQEENQSDDDEAFVDANEVPAPNITLLPLAEEASCVTVENSQEMTEVSSGMSDDSVPNFHAYTVFESTRTAFEGPSNHSEEPAEVDSPSLVVSELEWDTCILINEGEMPGEINPRNDDDLQDIEVISTASSDDYCVVPLPACFNPDIPLNFEQEDHSESFASPKQEERDVTPLSEVLEDSEVDELPEPNPSFTPSLPVPVPVKVAHQVAETVIKHGVKDAATRVDTPTTSSVPRQIVWCPPVEIATTSTSAPVAPQTPFLERNPFMPSRLPASPPGRAVPVFPSSISYPAPDLTGVKITCTTSFPLRHASDVMSNDDGGHDGPETVRTQPPEVLLSSSPVYSSGSAVTSQPQGVSLSPPQSTAQFASTFMSGTLASAKRAFGTVSDTVSTLMNGRDGYPVVVYNQQENDAHVVVTQEIETPRPSTEVPESMSKMDYLIDMGFGDRSLNERLLKKHNDNVSQVVTELLSHSDNDWSTGRHAAR